MSIPTMEQITDQVGVAVGVQSVQEVANQSLNHHFTTQQSQMTGVLKEAAKQASTFSEIMQYVSAAALPIMICIGMAPIGLMVAEGVGMTAEASSWMAWFSGGAQKVMIGLEGSAYASQAVTGFMKAYYTISSAGERKVESLADTQISALFSAENTNNKVITQDFKTQAALGSGIKDALSGALTVGTNYKG